MRRPTSIPIEHVKNIRDLLVVGIAPELGLFMAGRKFTDDDWQNPSVVCQEIVGFVLDHITERSFQLLTELAARGGEPPPSSQGET
jgi:hypothetical protein